MPSNLSRYADAETSAPEVRRGGIEDTLGRSPFATLPGGRSPETMLTIPGNTTTTATIAVGATVVSAIEFAGDVDWFGVTLTAGTSYYISLSAVGGNGLSDSYLSIYNSAGSLLASNDDSILGETLNSFLVYTPTTTGTYYLGAEAYSTETGTYALGIVQPSVADSVAGSTATTATISVGGAVVGRIETLNDADWFAVTLTAGQSYTFSLNAVGIAAVDLSDPYLSLHSSTGAQITFNDDAIPGVTLNSQITYTALTTGTYYVSARGFNNTTGLYALDVAQVTADTVPGNVSTSATVAVGGTFSSIIDTPGDEDWIAVTLTAGQTYDISLTGVAGTPGPLNDAYLSLHNNNGTPVAENDDGGPGANSYLQYTAGYSGIYYINAAAFDTETGNYEVNVQLATQIDTIAGSAETNQTLAVGQSVDSRVDFQGDEDWFAVTLTAGQTVDFTLSASGASPMTDPTLLMFDGAGELLAFNFSPPGGSTATLNFSAATGGTYYVAARGFDTQLGTYTLSMAEGVTPPISNSIDWGSYLDVSGGVVNVYFATVGQTYDGETSLGWNAYEQQQAMAVLNSYSPYVNLTFQVTEDVNAAEFVLVVVDSLGAGVLGYFNPPETVNAGVGVFARDGAGWDEAGGGGLERGGYAFLTMLHEAGHGLGLAHPHDTGGTSSIMSGVTSSASTGLYGLNQGVFTVMSYIDGWPEGPLPDPTNAYGWQGSLMALDVAVLQGIYGANTTTNSGATTYTLPATNAAGTYYQLIWDVSGHDTIQANAAATAGVVINLNPASITYAPGGGGWVSYTEGVTGGFTIANGVVIESAVGGAYNDTIYGSTGREILYGMGGDDTILGGAGDDLISGGGGNDWLVGQEGDDTLDAGNSGTDVLIGGEGFDTASFAWTDAGVYLDVSAGVYAAFNTWTVFLEIEAYEGSWGNDTMLGSASGDTLLGAGGNDVIIGLGGNDALGGGAGDDWLDGGDGDDILEGGAGVNILIGGAGLDLASYASATTGLWIDLSAGVYAGDDVWDVFYVSIDGAIGGSGNDYMIAAAGGSTLMGGDGLDTLIGGVGDDHILGGDGGDWIVAGAGNDRLDGGLGVDVYTSGTGADIFDLGSAAGWDVAFDFDPVNDRFDLDGNLWLGLVQADWDGDGQNDDTMLGYAGGNFVALDVSGLTLDQWNALVIA